MVGHGERKKARQGKAIGLIVATLSGGSLMQTCQTRLREDIIDGTENFILSLLDPTLYLENLQGSDVAEP
jgi:hypothetical protein